MGMRTGQLDVSVAGAVCVCVCDAIHLISLWLSFEFYIFNAYAVARWRFCSFPAQKIKMSNFTFDVFNLHMIIIKSIFVLVFMNATAILCVAEFQFEPRGRPLTSYAY